MTSAVNSNLKARPAWTTAVMLFASGLITGQSLSQIARKPGLF